MAPKLLEMDSPQAARTSLSSMFRPDPWLPAGTYRTFPSVDPYARIPAASQTAADSAEKLYVSLGETFPGIVSDFETRWDAWERNWLTADNLSSRPGKDNDLETDKDYLVDPDDVLNFPVLQRQANLIVDMNYERNRLVQARIEAWKAHCTRSLVHSGSAMYTGCEEYDHLFELGPSIISHLMLAYSKDKLGFWYELLHEIVHGLNKKTGLCSIDFREQYAAWDAWFQHGEHEQAPHWDNGVRTDSGTR